MSREGDEQGCCVLTLLDAISPTERRVCSVSNCSRHQSSSSSVSCASCSPMSSGGQACQGGTPSGEPMPLNLHTPTLEAPGHSSTAPVSAE